MTPVQTDQAAPQKNSGAKRIIGKLGIFGTPAWWAYNAASRLRFSGSNDYWERRYASGRTSGAGSYGRLAGFKADFLNRYVADNGISSVIEFGCGDGNQLSLANYPEYVGVDVSPTAVESCAARFEDDPSRSFKLISEVDPDATTADLALSLDVIYHLVEDEVFEQHITTLFKVATRAVIIYSSNHEGSEFGAHIRHRKFTDRVENITGWSLANHVENPYPFDRRNPDETSWADFYVFEPAK